MDKVSSAKMLRGSSAALHAESNVPCTQTPIFLHRSLLDTIPHTASAAAAAVSAALSPLV